jgi:hypothetical protein
MSASETEEIKTMKRVIITIEISTLTAEEKAVDEIFASLNVDFPNHNATFLDITMALFELEKAKEHLLKAGSVMETKVFR